MSADPLRYYARPTGLVEQGRRSAPYWRALIMSVKQRLKAFLQDRNLVFSWNEPVRAVVTIVDAMSTRVDPDGFIMLVRMRRPPAELGIVLNGRKLEVGRISSSSNNAVYAIDTGDVEHGENIVAMPRSPRVRIRGIYPAWSDVERAIKSKSEAALIIAIDEAASPPFFTQMHGAQPAEGARSCMVWSPVDDARDPRDLARAHLVRSVDAPSRHFLGLAPGCYDLDSSCHRLRSWIWTNGAVIAGLLDGSDRSAESPAHLSVALAVGDRLLDFQIAGGEHDGAFPVRWDVTKGSPCGFASWLAPNDVAFLASYGLMSLHRASGEARFLNGAKRAGEWILRSGLEQSGRLRLGYRLDTRKWVRDWLYVDAGFVCTLMRDLLQSTYDERWAGAIERFLDWYIDRFLVPTPGYFCVSVTDDCTRQRRREFARGQAWALDGLLAGWEAIQKPAYLEVAQLIGAHLLETQTSVGAWNYDLAARHSGICNKGTPIIGYHLARLGRLTGRDTFTRGGAMAAAWCRAVQIRSWPSAEPIGGIPGRNDEGAISGRMGIATVFPYASAFYLMLEGELRSSLPHLPGDTRKRGH